MPTPVPSDALPKLQELATWVSQSAEMKGSKPELLECVDNDRKEKARPLLEKLGYANIKHTALLLRICGKASIAKPISCKLLFFPLSGEDVNIDGEILTSGTYIELTKTLELDARLDCLILIV
ncbi:hypothetical protein N7478_003786 [Penicillium angulare]|uniref:uncharacterized protein n=1 Tax=Penicillium angulare TaxID=116970 RepID=UPI00254168FF|nr:uncharacterized protein N7478_003786 [Penicillium angulare]KAJ5288100.1 hypothetical protein N7478_003786 [Penicillium angulare]